MVRFKLPWKQKSRPAVDGAATGAARSAAEAEAANAARSAADALRDAGDWPAAAEAYARYLQLRADDWALWIQYGHCVKESGHFAAALRLYQTALQMVPDNADLHLQIGHAHKLLGDITAAEAAYQQALELDPGNRHALEELAALAKAAVLAPGPDAGAQSIAVSRDVPLHHAAPPDATLPRERVRLRIAIDVSDWLAYLACNAAPTGIQKMQANILRDILRRDAPDVAPCAFDAESNCWRALPAAACRQLLALGEGAIRHQDAAVLDAAMAQLRAAPMVALVADGCLVTLGASWALPGHWQRIAALKARDGARVVAYVHDCIPLMAPEYCEAAAVVRFTAWFAAMCLHADQILVNSEWSADDIRDAIAQLMPTLNIPITVIRLDARIMPVEEASNTPPMRSSERPFVLCVATLEARKNHAMVFRAWQQLLQRHGADRVPDLVCVGRRGFQAEISLMQLAAMPSLAPHVQILQDVPEAALHGLYRDCLFTVFNSHYEGWGMPVTESLSFGRVPVVPRHTSLPEAGGQAALYFAPDNEAALVTVLESLILSPDVLREREALLAAGAPLRSWSDVAADIIDACAVVPAVRLPPAGGRAPLRLGRRYRLHARAASWPDVDSILPALAAPWDGWGHADAAAWWPSGGSAQLRLALPPNLPAAAPAILYLELQAGDAATVGLVRISAGGTGLAAARLSFAPRERLLHAVPLHWPDGGDLLIELSLAPGHAAPCPGLHALTLCRGDDVAGRLAVLEHGLLGIEAI